jgi:hypothetical protein
LLLNTVSVEQHMHLKVESLTRKGCRYDSYFFYFSYLCIHAEVKHITFKTKSLTNKRREMVAYFKEGDGKFLREDLRILSVMYVVSMALWWASKLLYFENICTSKDCIRLNPLCYVCCKALIYNRYCSTGNIPSVSMCA